MEKSPPIIKFFLEAKMHRLFIPTYLSLIFILTGCGQEENRGTASGIVTLNSVPLTEGTIVFENTGKGIALTGPILADGSYKLASHKGIGLATGTYKVSISPAGMLRSSDEIPLVGKNPPPPKDVRNSLIPKKYQSNATSGLNAEVKAGENPRYDFNLVTK